MQVISSLADIGHFTLPPGRDELLTEHAIHWNRRKINIQASSLVQRYKKVKCFQFNHVLG